MTLADRSVYPTQPEALRATIEQLLDEAPVEEIEGEILALILPDSNLLQSAPVAAYGYRLLRDHVDEFRIVTIIAPSHDGAFDRIAICKVNEYRTPLGAVRVDDRVRNELCDEDDDIFIDDRGHYHTEGVDVQLPFLQQISKEPFTVVPIVMGRETPAFCHELGLAVGEVMYGQRMLLIATADILDAEDDALAQFVDALEIFDTSTLMHLLASEQVHVEGMGPVITTVMAAQHRGANRARILKLEPPDGDQAGAIAAVLYRQ